VLKPRRRRNKARNVGPNRRNRGRKKTENRALQGRKKKGVERKGITKPRGGIRAAKDLIMEEKQRKRRGKSKSQKSFRQKPLHQSGKSELSATGGGKRSALKEPPENNVFRSGAKEDGECWGKGVGGKDAGRPTSKRSRKRSKLVNWGAHRRH